MVDDFETGEEIVNALAAGVEPDPARARILTIVQAAQRTYFRDGLMKAATILGNKADEYDFSDLERQWLRDEFMKAIR